MPVPKSILFFCSSDRPFGCRKWSPDWIIVLSIMLAPKSINLFCSSSRTVGCRMSPDCIVVLAMLALKIFFCSSAMEVSTVGGGWTTVLDFAGWKSCGPAPDRLTALSSARGGEPWGEIGGVSRCVSRSGSAGFMEMGANKLGANWSKVG